MVRARCGLPCGRCSAGFVAAARAVGRVLRTTFAPGENAAADDVGRTMARNCVGKLASRTVAAEMGACIFRRLTSTSSAGS